MSAELHTLETSLQAYLVEANSDAYNSKGAALYKYNNLKVFIDLKKTKMPHFVVRVGISEAVFHLGSCEKISGGLGCDERCIHHWFEKATIASSLAEAWKQAQRAEAVQMTNESDS